ncbi:hypothetical protein WN51_00567 [Melipona quadrifasciata]|uniref:Uncharacterized protein n=1 Tax=Melipona quadrifasciata TaxID=166423 RepID=A0A0N0BGD1_9HYME|nr:hypothetical protein WN51_00567 [Melipona quadrifasciata]
MNNHSTEPQNIFRSKFVIYVLGTISFVVKTDFVWEVRVHWVEQCVSRTMMISCSTKRQQPKKKTTEERTYRWTSTSQRDTFLL